MKYMIALIFLILIQSVMASSLQAASGNVVPPQEFARVFEDREACFLLYDMQADSYIARYGEQRCQQPLNPCSTFKYPNALIALDIGLVENEDTLWAWDKQPKRIKAWERDHTLDSAFASSVLWYFQEIARRAGKDVYKDYLARFNYGNQDISGDLTTFWLGKAQNGTLLVSPEQQIAFLNRLYRNDLPVSEKAMRMVRNIAVFRHDGDTVLSGKTGTCEDVPNSTRLSSWFVGHALHQGRAYTFTTNIYSDRNETGFVARTMTLHLLKVVGLIAKE